MSNTDLVNSGLALIDLAPARANLVSALDAKDATIAAKDASIADLTAKLAAAMTAPAPTPAPAPSPTPVPGTIDFAVAQQNMTLQAGGYYRGNLGADGSTDANKCYVQTRLAVTPAYGARVRVTHKERHNVVYKAGWNLKDKRNFDGTYPNDYESMDGSNTNKKITTEANDGIVLNFRDGQPWNVAWYAFPFKKDTWQTIVKEYTFQTAPGKADAHLKITVDGAVVFDEGNLKMDSVGAPGTRKDFGSQMVLSSPSSSNKLPAGSYFEAYPPVVELL